MTQTSAECTVRGSWWWAEELPETCRVLCKNKFEILVHVVGFIEKKFITIHGHMNVKKCTLTVQSSFRLRRIYSNVWNFPRHFGVNFSLHGKYMYILSLWLLICFCVFKCRMLITIKMSNCKIITYYILYMHYLITKYSIL